MQHSGVLKALSKVAALLSLIITLPAQATVYSVFGNIEFVANGSNVSLLTGQTIRDTLNNQYAGFTVDIDTTVADTNPAANQIELRNAVTSTAVIGNTSLSLGSRPCLTLDIDCRVTSSKDAFNINLDTQLISSQLHNTSALGVNGTLSFFINTSGQDLFVFARQKIIDPFDGNTSVNFSVFYTEVNSLGFGFQRVNFQLNNITATPVPEPETNAMLSLGLLVSVMLGRRKYLQS